MKSTRFCAMAVCVPAVMFATATTVQANNFMWQRSADWLPGTAPGGTANNPGPGAGGPVWQYEWTQGGALGSSNPWYAQPTNLMSWDPAWYNTGFGVWSKGDNVNPPIMHNRLVHNLHDTVKDDIPLVRWRAPFGQIDDLAINGNLIVHWTGMNGVGKPVDVDVVIAKQTQTGTSVLFSTTVSKPNPFQSVGDMVTIPVSLSDIELGAGDSIIITHRGRHGFFPHGAWVNLIDNVTLTAIPSPGSLAVLGIGVFAVARRRRS